jgi:hypothetical protein
LSVEKKRVRILFFPHFGSKGFFNNTRTQLQFLLGCLLHVFWFFEGFVKGFLATIKFARKHLEVNKLSAASCHDVQEMTEEAFIAW